MDDLNFLPVVEHLLLAAASVSVESLGAPGDVVHPAQRVYVQDVQVRGTVEDERESAEQDVDYVRALAEYHRDHHRYHVQTHDAQHHVPEGVYHGLPSCY